MGKLAGNIINEKQPTFKYTIEGWLFFLAQKFVLSIIIRIFAASVPTMPLNDAQMRGAFFIIRAYQSTWFSCACCHRSYLNQNDKYSS